MEFTDHLTDAHAAMIGKQAIFFTGEMDWAVEPGLTGVVAL